jgi:hypothetical protein
MGYNLQGSLLEVCDCQVLCPCWIGEDPDNGTCKAALAYQFDKGAIDGVDVSGLVLATTGFIPGNVLAGNWRTCIYIDERATDSQMNALVSVYKGEKGGPIADLAKLIGEVVLVERAKIVFDVKEGRGTLTIGKVVHAEMEPYRGPTGEPTKLVESIFSTIPGSPAYVAKASTYRMTQPALGIDIDLKNHNAIQGHFAFEA